MSEHCLAVPPGLRRGDQVALVAASSPIRPEYLPRAVTMLESWGLQVRVGTHALAQHHHGILAGSDQARTEDLMDAWLDDDVRAIFFARGGYGASRVLPLLDWTALAAQPPTWLIGASDVTALHAAAASQLSLATVHGPMAAAEVLVGDDPDTRSREMLRHTLAHPDVGSVHGSASWIWNSAPAAGQLIGGNLSVLASLAGTGWLPSADNAIVFLEDVNEAAYRIDRLLTQLLQSHWLTGAAGFALGSFVNCGSEAQLRAVVADRLAPLGKPIVGELPLGHRRPQESLVLGAWGELDMGDDAACGPSLRWSV